VRRFFIFGLASGVLALAVGGGAGAKPFAASAHCGPVRVDRFLHADPHGLFGASSIVARGTGCTTARRVASRYVHARGGPDSTQTNFAGWTCTFRGANVAQQIRVTCRRGGARVTFRDTLPSG
jgi:hypothetical protein